MYPNATSPYGGPYPPPFAPGLPSGLYGAGYLGGRPTTSSLFLQQQQPPSTHSATAGVHPASSGELGHSGVEAEQQDRPALVPQVNLQTLMRLLMEVAGVVEGGRTLLQALRGWMDQVFGLNSAGSPLGSAFSLHRLLRGIVEWFLPHLKVQRLEHEMQTAWVSSSRATASGSGGHQQHLQSAMSTPKSSGGLLSGVPVLGRLSRGELLVGLYLLYSLFSEVRRLQRVRKQRVRPVEVEQLVRVFQQKQRQAVDSNRAAAAAPVTVVNEEDASAVSQSPDRHSYGFLPRD